jgi:hypothetical protein
MSDMGDRAKYDQMILPCVTTGKDVWKLKAEEVVVRQKKICGHRRQYIGPGKEEEKRRIGKNQVSVTLFLFFPSTEVSHWQHASLVKSASVCSGGCYETCRVSYAVVHPGSKRGLPWWYRGGELTAVNVGLQEKALDGEESNGEQGWTNMQ